MSKSKTGSKALLWAGLGTVVTFAWLSSRDKKTTKSSGGTPKPLPSPASPFVAGSYCTELAEAEVIDRWLKTTVVPKAKLLMEAYEVPLNQHQAARLAIAKLVDDLYAASVPECPLVQSAAAGQLWKGLWCDVVAQMVLRGKLDEELDDVLRLCLDPSFDPRLHLDGGEKPPAGSADPRPHPMPPRPMPPRPMPAEPVEGATPPSLPANLRNATTRKELSTIGVMRMLEGTVAGAPSKGPSRRLVLFAVSPFWPGRERTRVAMARLAAKHPSVSFVEVSFADTQRHFGKPKDLGGLIWMLTAAAPDGRVFPSPIVRNDPRAEPPSPQQWAALIAHATGSVRSRSVRKITRPRHFGDLTRSTASPRQSGVGARQRQVGVSRKTPRRAHQPGG